MIKLSIHQPPGLKEFLSNIPRFLQKIAIKAAGDETENYLRKNTEPPQNYITRKAAYGRSFFSDAQRGFFFASLKSGKNVLTGEPFNVPYNRTHALAEGWERIDTPMGATFKNDNPAAQWTIGEKRTRHEKIVGWRKAYDIFASGRKQIIAAAKRAVHDYLEQRPWR
jgi:hypothetical protein